LNGASAELVRGIAEASRFPSRGEDELDNETAPRIHRTGPTMQFNAGTTPQTVEALDAIADPARMACRRDARARPDGPSACRL
jgi:hypothetical protein